MDETGTQAGHGPRPGGTQQGEPGVHPFEQEDRGHRRPQGEAAVHGQVWEIQHRVGDIHPVGQQGVDETLGQGGNDQV